MSENYFPAQRIRLGDTVFPSKSMARQTLRSLLYSRPELHAMGDSYELPEEWLPAMLDVIALNPSASRIPREDVAKVLIRVCDRKGHLQFCYLLKNSDVPIPFSYRVF